MNTVMILLGAQLLFSMMSLWGLLAMARRSDRQLAVAWRKLQESKIKVDVGLIDRELQG